MTSVTTALAGDRGADTAGLIIRSFAARQAEDWDDLVRRSCNGTFLHTRRFLSYHRDRFADRSLVLYGRRGRVAGVFPAAVSPADRETIVSHPSITGGSATAGCGTRPSRPFIIQNPPMTISTRCSGSGPISTDLTCRPWSTSPIGGMSHTVGRSGAAGPRRQAYQSRKAGTRLRASGRYLRRTSPAAMEPSRCIRSKRSIRCTAGSQGTSC